MPTKKKLPSPIATGSPYGPIIKTAATGGMAYYPPRWFTPLLSFVHFFIPWDRATLNSQIRYYDTFHSLVGTAVDLHAELPLSSFELKNVRDPVIKAFYEETLEHIGAASLMFDMLREYWLLGEVFVHLNWSDQFGTFTKAEILIPERVRVKMIPLTTEEEEQFKYEYLIDMELLKHTSSELLKQLPSEITIALTEGRNLELNPQNLMVMMRKTCPYDERGTSIVLRVFRELIYESKIMESMYAIADRWISPKEIWKIGDSNYIPDEQQLEDFRRMLLEAENQPQFTLVTHGLTSVDIVGASGKWPNLQTEYDWVEKRILAGLFLNKAMIHGEGPTYATASIGYRTLMSKYLAVRAKLERVWKEKFFLPIALANEFYETSGGETRVRKPYAERVPVIPDFEWRHKADLMDDQSYRNLIMQLRQRGDIPMEIISEIIGYDIEYIQEALEREAGTILDPAFREFKKREMELGLKSVPKPASMTGIPELGSYKEIMKENAKEIIEGASEILGAKETEEIVKEVEDSIPEDAKFGLISRGMHGKAEAAAEALKINNPYIQAIASRLNGEQLKKILSDSEYYNRILAAIKRNPEKERKDLYDKFSQKEEKE